MVSLKLLSQVGIGTTSPNTTAILEVSSDTKGITFPHVALIDTVDKTTVPYPVDGTTVFNTSTTNGMATGIYFWNTYQGAGGQWERLLDSNTDIDISYMENDSIVKYNYIVVINSGYPRETIAANSKFNITVPSASPTYVTYSNKAPGGINMANWQTFPSDTNSPYMNIGTGTFIAPTTANYQITCGVYGAYQSSGGSGTIALYMTIDGVTDASRADIQIVRDFNSDLEYTYIGPLNAGQQIRCYITQDSGRNFTTQNTYFYANYIR